MSDAEQIIERGKDLVVTFYFQLLKFQKLVEIVNLL